MATPLDKQRKTDVWTCPRLELLAGPFSRGSSRDLLLLELARIFAVGWVIGIGTAAAAPRQLPRRSAGGKSFRARRAAPERLALASASVCVTRLFASDWVIVRSD